ncbi:phosphotransacetylase family protein [Candidatus Hydrogenedentota bacterium]
MFSIFIVATGKDVGKTTVSLGLVSLFASQGLRVGFCKPVGQQFLKRDEGKIDKDSVLMQNTLPVTGNLADMSPVTVPSGFVENYLYNPDVEPLKKKILDAYERLSKDCDVMVIEGTGHAGVGSCFDLSNADVAAMLGAPALMVVGGGIGKTLDEISVSRSFFEAKGVEILGVVANKVFTSKIVRVKKALTQGTANMGLKLLGAIPYDIELTYPMMGQIATALKAEVLCGENALGSSVESVTVAAMEPQNVLPRLGVKALMITPGDRIDNILVALNAGLCNLDEQNCVVGVALTGGLVPHPTVVNLMNNSGLPVLLCQEDTYSVTSKVHSMLFKIQPEDTDKIKLAQELVQEHIDTDELIKLAKKG